MTFVVKLSNAVLELARLSIHFADYLRGKGIDHEIEEPGWIEYKNGELRAIQIKESFTLGSTANAPEAGTFAGYLNAPQEAKEEE